MVYTDTTPPRHHETLAAILEGLAHDGRAGPDGIVAVRTRDRD